MPEMILRMSIAMLAYILATVLIHRYTDRHPLRRGGQILLGVVFGGFSILSTHFGISYDNMVLNLRDLGPLAAGLFFHPLSGIIAGVLGGVERYLASVLWNIGNYTRVACASATILAGFLAALLNRFVFRGKQPRPFFAFFMGAVVEVFHMYAVFLTHRNDVTNAYVVVRTCALPMIFFTGLGLFLCSLGTNPEGVRATLFHRLPPEKKELSRQFQFWLLLSTCTVFLINFGISYSLSTQTALEEARYKLSDWAGDIRNNYLASNKSIEELGDYLQNGMYTDAKLVAEGVTLAGGVENASEEVLESYRKLSATVSVYTMDAKGQMIRGVGDPWSDLVLINDGEGYLDGLRKLAETETIVLDESSDGWMNAVVPCGEGYVRLSFDYIQMLENMRFSQLQGLFTDYNLTDEADYYLFYIPKLIDAPSYFIIASSLDSVESYVTTLTKEQWEELSAHEDEDVFYSTLFAYPALCKYAEVDEKNRVLILYRTSTAFASRDAQVYENAFSDLLVFAAIFIMVSILMEHMLASPLRSVNSSLNRIIGGHLDETLSVNTSSEFATLSRDINMTVDTLKQYISAAEKRMEQELLMAKTIQAAALPRAFDVPRNEFLIYALMDPAKEVGGDFYDFFFVGPNRLALVIADVSGKGIPAALFMMRSKTAIRNLAEKGQSPAEIFSQVNHTLCDGNDAEMFVTAWIGIIDLATGDMVCANAGHEYPAILRAGGEYELLRDKHSLALAAMDGVPMKEYSLHLDPGDRLFVYTDGVPEAINEQVEQYGTDRLLEELNAHREQPPKILLPLARENLRRFVGKADQFDDITMLGFSYLRRTGDAETPDPASSAQTKAAPLWPEQ